MADGPAGDAPITTYGHRLMGAFWWHAPAVAIFMLAAWSWVGLDVARDCGQPGLTALYARGPRGQAPLLLSRAVWAAAWCALVAGLSWLDTRRARTVVSQRGLEWASWRAGRHAIAWHEVEELRAPSPWWSWRHLVVGYRGRRYPVGPHIVEVDALRDEIIARAGLVPAGKRRWVRPAPPAREGEGDG
jgi:hypothetical protein